VSACKAPLYNNACNDGGGRGKPQMEGGEGDGAEPHSAGASSQPEEAREKARVERVQEWLIHEEVVGGRLAGGQEA
jgi:hypothetical protein